MTSLDLITDASPSNRNYYCAYVALQNESGEPVGTYVQGLYQLAQIGKLKCQVEAQAYTSVENLKAENPALYKKLYHDNGVLKTAFELAVINKLNKDDIQNAITAEYTWQNADPRGRVPQDVFKVQVDAEWLSNLKLASSKLKMKSYPQGMMITVDNFKPATADKWLHGIMQVLGLLVTTTTFVGLAVSLLPMSWLASLSGVGLAAAAIGLTVVGMFIAETIQWGNSAGFFGIGESLWVDGQALLSKHFLKEKGTISWGKLAKSAGFTAAIGTLGFLAASATFSATLALPVISGLGIGANLIAGAFAGLTFMGSCIGASIPVRYFAGFGIWNNAIPLETVNNAKIVPLKPTRLAPKPTADEKAKGITHSAPNKAQRKEAKILSLTQKLESVQKAAQKREEEILGSVNKLRRK